MTSGRRPRRRRKLSPQELLQVIQQYVQCNTWYWSRRTLEEYPELLTEEAEELFDRLIEAQTDKSVRRYLEEHRKTLRRCREVGIEEAFAEREKGIA